MSIIETLLTQHPVRKTGAQKAAFREWFTAWAQEQGYTAQVESGWNLAKCHNIVVGAPENAEVTFTAHYDTQPVMFLPNFITPCNVLIYFVYQLILCVVLFAVPMLLGALMGWLGGMIHWKVGILAGGFTSTGGMIAVVALMMFGPANKHCANDNTSGVAAVMELMQRLPEEQRGKAAFILFDNEELGLLGSGAYASKHKNVRKSNLLINMDCVGDGENMLFFANKKTRALPCFPLLEQAMGGAQGRNFVMNQMEKCIYPSDQANFKLGVAVCACNRAKVIGYYCDKIHTPKDTICEQVNLDFLAEGLAAFVASL